MAQAQVQFANQPPDETPLRQADRGLLEKVAITAGNNAAAEAETEEEDSGAEDWDSSTTADCPHAAAVNPKAALLPELQAQFPTGRSPAATSRYLIRYSSFRIC